MYDTLRLDIRDTLSIVAATMQTVSDIFEAFGGPARFAEATGLKSFHAQTMKTRASIPVRYWPKVIEAAKAQNIEGVTYESLVHVHASKTEAAQ